MRRGVFCQAFPFLLLLSGHGIFMSFLRVESQRSWIKIESLAICYMRPVRQDTSPLPLHQVLESQRVIRVIRLVLNSGR